MRLIFESEEERDEKLHAMVRPAQHCPSLVGLALPGVCTAEDCTACWYKALRNVAEIRPTDKEVKV